MTSSSSPQAMSEVPSFSPREEAGLALFYDMLGPTGSVRQSNMVYVVKLNGHLDVPAFKKAIERIFQENPQLRTYFSALGEAPAKCLSREPIPFTYVDCASDRASFRRGVESAIDVDFDLSRYPLVKVTLVRHSEGRYIFAIVGHHVMLDGWSFMLFLRMLSEYYVGLLRGETRCFAPGCSFNECVQRMRAFRATPEFAELHREVVDWMRPATDCLRRTQPFSFPIPYEENRVVRFEPDVVSRLGERYGQQATTWHRMVLVLLFRWLTRSCEIAFTEAHPNRGLDAVRLLFGRNAVSREAVSAERRPRDHLGSSAWRVFGMLSDDLLIRVPSRADDTLRSLREKLARAYGFARRHDRVPASGVLRELCGSPLLPRFHVSSLSPGFDALRLGDCRVTHLKQLRTYALSEITVFSISPTRLLVAISSPRVEGRTLSELERALHVFAEGLLAPDTPVEALLARSA